jgi:hypothetical protein
MLKTCTKMSSKGKNADMKNGDIYLKLPFLIRRKWGIYIMGNE